MGNLIQLLTDTHQGIDLQLLDRQSDWHLRILVAQDSVGRQHPKLLEELRPEWSPHQTDQRNMPHLLRPRASN